MVQIAIPQVHSFQSALKQYQLYKRIYKFSPRILIFTICWLILSYILFDKIPNAPVFLTFGMPLFLFMFSFYSLIFISNNIDSLKSLIIKSWLNGSEEKFIEIEKNLDNFISDLPKESKEDLKNRRRKEALLKVKMLVFYILGGVVIISIAAIIEYLLK